ncbi:hypothetical protein ACS0TY_032430 [Phlomoides rotata]
MASATLTIEAEREGAEIYHGDATCEEKLQKILEEFSVPRYLIYVAGLEEFGFKRSTGFFWLKQKSKTERKIKSVGTVTTDVEITGFIEKRHMSKITGVKGKELFIALPVSDMFVGVPSSDKVKVKSTTGLWRVHPLKAFEV